MTKEYSPGYGDRYPSPNTSGRAIWDACISHEVDGKFPTKEFLQSLNLKYINKHGTQKKC